MLYQGSTNALSTICIMLTLDNLHSFLNLVALMQEWQSKMRFWGGGDPGRADDDHLAMGVCKADSSNECFYDLDRFDASR